MRETESISIQSEDDIQIILNSVRTFMSASSFSEIDKQKVLVSVSELTRNVIDHASGIGHFWCELTDRSIRFSVHDRGSGIPNVEAALAGKKRPNSRGLGLGLAGARRLMDEFRIETSEKGTTIVAAKYS